MIEHGFYNIDCMEGLKDIPDKAVDLAICDPPYGIGITSTVGGGKPFGSGGGDSLSIPKNTVRLTIAAHQTDGTLKN